MLPKKIRELIKRGTITFLATTGTLSFRANQLTRLLVSDVLVASLKKLVVDGKGNIEGIYRTTFLSENVFAAGPNQVVSQELALESNSFERVEQVDAGTVIGRSAVFLGNRAANDIRLSNVTARSEKAANLLLNIVDT